MTNFENYNDNSTFMETNEFELILINIAGKDRPGLTSALTGILGK